jgi:hypothetical protein
MPQGKVPFVNAKIAQNTDRTNFLNQLSGNQDDVARLQMEREAATSPHFQAATNTPYNPSMLQSVINDIDNKIAQVGTTTQAGRMLGEMKNNILSESKNPEKLGPLIQMYRENRDNFAKKMLQDGAVTPAVNGIVYPANKALGDALTRNNEDVAYANAIFQQKSEPINQMQVMQDIKGRITGTTEAGGDKLLSQPKLSRIVEANEISTPKGNKALADALSPDQYKGLLNLERDMARDSALNVTPSASQSQTFQNMAAGNFMRNLTGGRVSHQIPIVGSLYHNAEEQINEKLVHAMLNKDKMIKLPL